LIPTFSSPSTPSFITQRQNQGFIPAVVDVEDVYDEFSYGEHGPQAIKDFLLHAATNWATKPRYVIFAGDASLDPRNYQNVGNFDFVPTKLVDATFSETASDDWLADFSGAPVTNGPDGIADIPVGRLPLRTVAEANLVLSKIVNYTPANVPQAALLVADDPGTPPVWDFEESSDNVQALLPASMPVQKSYRRLEIKVLTGTISTNSSSTTVTGTGTLFTTPAEIQVGTIITKNTGERLGTVASIASATSLTLAANAASTHAGTYGKQDDATATANIVAGFNQGRAIVNYSGHGNVNVWTGAAIFTTVHATGLTNGNKLSFVVVMDCLNGYYHDPVLLSLSEAFLKAPNGGAVATFASSGLTTTFGQRQMELQLYTSLYGAQPIAVGDAIKIAKAASGDIDVRTTWIYFGDPSLQIR
jgi:peptidase C25-like protein